MRSVVLVVALVGCSFSAQGPRTKDPSVRPDCTRNADGRIALDGLGGTIWGLVGIVGLVVGVGTSGDEETETLTSTALALGIGGGLLSALHFSALVSGSNATRACRDANKRHAAWSQGRR